MSDRTAKPIWEESWFCKLLILASAVAWGVSFFVLKGVIAEFPVFFVLVFRFMVSGLLLLVIFRKSVCKHLDAGTVGFGVVLGVLFWAGYAFQTFGLEQTTPGKNAFITATYCVLVPFFAWMLGMGKPKTNNIVGAVLCLVGLGFVALDGGFPLNQGDVLTFGCAVTYGLMYALISWRGDSYDVWTISVIELLVTGVLSIACMLIRHEVLSASAFTLANVGALLGLTLVCSAATTIAVNYAFTQVDPTSGSLLSSMEAPTGVLFSVLFAGEELTSRVLIGFVLIFFAVVVSEAGPGLLARIRGTSSNSVRGLR